VTARIDIHRPLTERQELARKAELALGVLLQSYELAQQLKCTPLEFAVKLQQAYAAGVSASTIRWLVLKGCIQHVTESTTRASKKRLFRASHNLRFCDRSCFLLTKRGIGSARKLLSDTSGIIPATEAERETPFWDVGRRTLFLGSHVVKRFKYLASNQELVLIAFQAQGWPARIEDPLPLLTGKSRKRRLHDTIKQLNQAQVHRLMHFYGDGSSRGICWEITRQKR
jgi:hypothetical protein